MALTDSLRLKYPLLRPLQKHPHSEGISDGIRGAGMVWSGLFTVKGTQTDRNTEALFIHRPTTQSEEVFTRLREGFAKGKSFRN